MNSAIKKIKEWLPNCVTEFKSKDGKIKLGINFKILKQELSDVLIGDWEEKYELNWVGKKKCILESNLQTDKVLIPCKEESVNWDTTGNMYIEGDNLDALKILKKEYSNKIRLIYIDPPYNTGKTRNVRGYNDKFSHSDWLNMMYPRLKLARGLLTDDGVIFISIDDHEVHNLRKICDDIFGEENFVAIFNWMKTATPPSLSKNIRKKFEYVLCYLQDNENKGLNGGVVEGGAMPLINETNKYTTLKIPKENLCFKIPDGIYKSVKYGRTTIEEGLEIQNGKALNDLILSGNFKWSQQKLDEEVKSGTRFWIKTDKFAVRYERIGARVKTPANIISKEECNVLTNEEAQKEIKNLFLKKIIDYPKPTSLIKYLVSTYIKSDDFVMDFFSGSATTAHAVMKLNAEDDGNRKFIMVQLPEPCNEKSEAFKSGYKNICEIGKERIRRAGKKIIEETGKTDLDIGFRVFKIK